MNNFRSLKLNSQRLGLFFSPFSHTFSRYADFVSYSGTYV